MMKSMSVSAVLCAFTLLTNAAQAQDAVNYTFTAFDVPFAGGSNTKAFDITPGGDIVGRFFDANFGGSPRGFLRYRDGSFASPIDVPVPNTGTVARGVDSARDIVGKWFDLSGTHGFFRSAGGGFLLFDVPFADAIAGTTVANSLSNNGVIVGEYTAPTSISICPAPLLFPHAFVRNADATFTAIDVPGAVAESARGVDDSGNIVGVYVTIPASTTTCNPAEAVVNAHGFVRDAHGNYTTFDFPDATNTLLARISDSGDITGWYTDAVVTIQILGDTIPVPVSSFVWFQNGTLTSLDIPYPNASTRGINPRANVVGVYTDAQGDHAFLGSR